MKQNKVVKIICILSYSLIILMGDMVGIPFLFWLITTSVDFGNSDQLFAIAGFIGFSMMFTNLYKKQLFRMLVFVLMITPIVRRITEVPFEKFNYLAFQIPVVIFIITSLILIFQLKKGEKIGYNNV